MNDLDMMALLFAFVCGPAIGSFLIFIVFGLLAIILSPFTKKTK